jgi:hypothetical protein
MGAQQHPERKRPTQTQTLSFHLSLSFSQSISRFRPLSSLHGQSITSPPPPPDGGQRYTRRDICKAAAFKRPGFAGSPRGSGTPHTISSHISHGTPAQKCKRDSAHALPLPPHFRHPRTGGLRSDSSPPLLTRLPWIPVLLPALFEGVELRVSRQQNTQPHERDTPWTRTLHAFLNALWTTLNDIHTYIRTYKHSTA